MVSPTTQVGTLVAENFRAAEVFSKYGIDFCCGGKQTVETACKKDNIDISTVIADLDEIMSEDVDETINFQSWPADLLVDYIEKKFHRKIRSQSPAIMKYLDKLCKVHGENHPELFEVREEFSNSVTDITKHLSEEEVEFFPIIRKKFADELTDDDLTKLNYHINSLIEDHKVEGARFEKISQLTNNYEVPSDGCKTYKIGMLSLKDFQNDLHKHVHLENNILFEKLN